MMQSAEDAMDTHRRRIKTWLGRFELGDPPSPWIRSGVHAVGGLTEVGYAEGTDLLLVVSSQGRGVFDALSGERVARDHEVPSDDGEWYDRVLLRAGGIGILADSMVRLAGLHGGGLPYSTYDGWSLQLASPEWPEESIFLAPPGRAIFPESFAEGCVKIATGMEFRAYGFSETGKSFVIASGHTLELFSRADL